jgi:hypothetical protein
MRRPSLSNLLAFWTGNTRGPSASARPQPASVRFTPAQLDRLYQMLVPGRDGAASTRAPRWHDDDAGSARRQETLLHTVDRAIAELASPRGRRRRARW